jgi:hypothetical protein
MLAQQLLGLGIARQRESSHPHATSVNTYSCCPSRIVSVLLPAFSPTTNSNPAFVGSIVINEIVPSSLFRDATALFHSPRLGYTICPPTYPAAIASDGHYPFVFCELTSSYQPTESNFLVLDLQPRWSQPRRDDANWNVSKGWWA